jgi:hypothetical protein
MGLFKKLPLSQVNEVFQFNNDCQIVLEKLSYTSSLGEPVYHTSAPCFHEFPLVRDWGNISVKDILVVCELVIFNAVSPHRDLWRVNKWAKILKIKDAEFLEKGQGLGG